MKIKGKLREALEGALKAGEEIGKDLLDGVAGMTKEGLKESEDALRTYRDVMADLRKKVESGTMTTQQFGTILTFRRGGLRKRIRAIGNEKARSILEAVVDSTLRFLEAIVGGAAKTLSGGVVGLGG